MLGEQLEMFEAPEGLSEVTFRTTVDVGCPYREDGRDEYEVRVGYGPHALCAAGGSLDELIKSYEHATISAEELAVEIGKRVREALDPRYLQIEIELLNAPFELVASAELSDNATGR